MTNYLIRNCKFRYKCNEQWQGMDLVNPESDKIRFCRVCQENVYLCENDQELSLAIRHNYCALYENLGDEVPALIGDVDPGYLSGGELNWD